MWLDVRWYQSVFIQTGSYFVSWNAILIGHLKGGFRTSISILVYYDSCAFSSFNSNFLPLFQFLIILPWLELHPISSSAGLVPGNGSWWLILPGLESVTRGPFPGVNSKGNMFKLQSQFYSFEWQSSLWWPRQLRELHCRGWLHQNPLLMTSL
jgi:hypothetical protein